MTRQCPKTHALRLWLSLAFLLFCAHSARAAPQTYVSAKGNDANTCQQIAPCRTFAGALAKTDIRGEVGFIAYYARMHLQDCVSTDQAWGVNSTHSAHVTIDGCALTYNDTGLWVYAGSIVRLSDTTVAHNKLGIHAFDSEFPSADGKVYTFGNNRVSGNTQNTKGTPILVLSQL